MNNALENKLSRLADKLALAKNIISPNIMEDAKAYSAYVTLCEAQAILWMLGEEAQDDINRIGDELEAKLLRKGNY